LLSTWEKQPTSTDLQRLLSEKTNVQYSATLATNQRAKEMLRYASRLIEGMQQELKK